MELVTNPTVLSIGLKAYHLEVIERILRDHPENSLQLVQLSPLDPDLKLVEGVQQAAVIFIYWEGVKGPTLSAIRRFRAQTSAAGGRIHMIYDNPEPLEAKSKNPPPTMKTPHSILDSRQSKILGIASWIKFPDRHLNIERILFEHTQQNPLSQITNGIGNSDSTTPEVQVSNLPTIEEIAPRDLLGKVEAAFHIKPKTSPSSASQKTSDKNIKTAFTFERLAVFHHDPERARELAKHVEGDAARTAIAISHGNELLACLMRGVDGLAIWFDRQTPETAHILRQIAEMSGTPSVPVALLIPDKDTLPYIKDQLSEFFFDIVIIYQRMRIALNESLKTLEASRNQPDSPRGILERLRRPMRLSAPPEFNRTATLQVAETLSQRLATKPGKAIWSPIEMIPYLLREGLHAAAVDKVNLIAKNQPHTFIAGFLDYQVNLAARAGPAATSVLKGILSRDALSPSRRLQLGQIAYNHGSVSDLLLILNSWQDQPQWRDEPEFYYLGGRYLTLVKHAQGTSYLAKAVLLDPMRVDFIAAYGEHLAVLHEHQYAVRFLRTIVSSHLCPWTTKTTLIKSLIEDRQFKEARLLLDQMMLEAPGNKDLSLLGQSLKLVA